MRREAFPTIHHPTTEKVTVTNDVLTAHPIETSGLPDAIDRLLPQGQREVWQLPRGLFAPRVLVLERDGEPVAAVLTSSRPHTAYVKVVDVWASEVAQVRALLAEVVERAERDGAAAVKLEAHPWSGWWSTGDASPLSSLGFERMRDPIVSSAGTDGAVAGYVRWSRPWAHDELVYYGQTTEFTCGAVAALIAVDHLGHPLLTETGGEENRNVEFLLWRQATNFPACEPVGLGVATIETLRQAGSDAEVDIHVSLDGPVLLNTRVPGGDGGFRAMLQAESRLRAEQLGRPVITDWVPIETIAEHLRAGSQVLLLIDDELMMNDAVPHWVVAHSLRDDVVLLQDPWIDAEGGETWVDAHDLPVGLDDVDLMTTYDDPAVRGIIVITPSGS